jgi:hypothetical protein
VTQQLAGSATTFKRRDKTKRVKCADCGKNIALRKELVQGADGKPYHLLCAGFVHHPKLTPCPVCFIVAPCNCVGTV